jgi:glutamate/aspartate transport system substrate-binding protein
MRRLALMLAAGLAIAAPARADDEGGVLNGTLKAIHGRGSIRLGHRDSAVPFSFLNRGGQPVGYSVDLCLAIAADVAAALNLDLLEPTAPAWQKGLRIAYVPVAAEARLPMVASGAIDLECGSTTANAERAKTVAFSPIFFLAGTKLLVKAETKADSYRALAGQTIAVTAGTTNADVMRRLAPTVTPRLTLLELPSTDAAFEAVATGKAAAMASDDILLAGTLALRNLGRQYRIIGDYLSFEPYALAFRKDDPDFAALVTASFRRLAEAGRLRDLYRAWFEGRLPSGERLNLPMSPHLAEIFRGLGQPD